MAQINPTTALRPELLNYVKASMADELTLIKAQSMSVPDLRAAVERHMKGHQTTQTTTGTATTTTATTATVPTTGAPDWLQGMINTIMTAIRPELDSIASKVGNGGQSAPRPVEVIVKSQDGRTLSTGTIAHEMQPTLLQRTLACRHAGGFPVLSGPAGSGKTFAGVQLAELITTALELTEPLQAYPLSFSPSSQIHELIGFQTVNGEFVPTDFYRGWKDGGVIILDELDATDAILLGLNSAIANGKLHFPGVGVVERHPHCYIIGGMNTTGRGATAAYNGRARIDAACRNRAIFIDWGYDEALELKIAGVNDATVNWVRRVQELRKALAELNKGGMAPDILISPRASIIGSAILQNDPSVRWEELENELIWQGATTEDRQRVLALVK